MMVMKRARLRGEGGTKTAHINVSEQRSNNNSKGSTEPAKRVSRSKRRTESADWRLEAARDWETERERERGS